MINTAAPQIPPDTHNATRPKRIALFGLFGSGNLGNDGSLQAMLEFLRVAQPAAHITCICADPSHVQEAFRVPALRIGWRSRTGTISFLLERYVATRKLLQLIHAIKTVQAFDALIVPGTGILDDYSERPWGFPASLVSWCSAARISGTKVAFVSVGAGPIQHRTSRWLMKTAARMAHYRTYRDTFSKDFMQSIGFDASRDDIYPDIAFKLVGPQPALSDPNPYPLTVGVGVMTYYGWRGDAERGAHIYNAYIEKIARFVDWLLSCGHRVRFLMGETTDHQAISDVASLVAGTQPDIAQERFLTSAVDSLAHLMHEIAETDVVVATRFHNVVCSLKLGKPTISIGYAKKNDVLMAEMGLEDYCQHIEKLDVDLLMKQFQGLVSNRQQHTRSILNVVRTYEARLREQDERLLIEIL